MVALIMLFSFIIGFAEHDRLTCADKPVANVTECLKVKK